MGSVEKAEIPRGIPKSGRIWKQPKTRFRSMIAVKPLKLTLEKSTQERLQRKKIRELEKEKAARDSAAREAKRKRCEANRKQREANERKGEVVTLIKNTAKIKRMKKKQLRSIKKRDWIQAENS
ncbi:coiled-coil domain-containing protein 86-like [Tropilaelaps mercedesae]|uniref:Coiled-coil domain-containing protein 86 n=1 Tax=Tropilaelaps mercedesae TaxID=418985 RepID=A0A1V9X0C9_9ACAR|nr:coiled-coil domain-containing protein 86-like [Tropilaelaps mercedesae]